MPEFEHAEIYWSLEIGYLAILPELYCKNAIIVLYITGGYKLYII